MCILIRDDRKRRHFRARAGRSRIATKYASFPSSGKYRYVYGYPRSPSPYPPKLTSGFSHHPHDLCGIHCGTAAQSDDAVRGEIRHGLRAFSCAASVGSAQHRRSRYDGCPLNQVFPQSALHSHSDKAKVSVTINAFSFP